MSALTREQRERLRQHAKISGLLGSEVCLAHDELRALLSAADEAERLTSENAALRERLAQAEAEAVALDRAIGVCVPSIIRCWLKTLPEDANEDRELGEKVLARVLKAIQGTAGADLLAEMGRMREALERIAVRASAQPVYICDVAKFDLAWIAKDARAALGKEPVK